MRRGAGTPKTLGVTADVRPRGPRLEWSHVLEATKLQRATQAKKAAMPAQDSAAISVSIYRDRSPDERGSVRIGTAPCVVGP